MLHIHNLPDDINALESILNKIIRVKLSIDYKKLFMINLFLLPKELCQIIFQFLHFIPIITIGKDNIIINTYDTHIFCEELFCASNSDKIITKRIKQLYVKGTCYVSLGLENNEAYLWNNGEYYTYEKRISKNIKQIYTYIDDDSSDFYFQSSLSDNMIYQIDLNEHSYMLDNGNITEITDETPFAMISCGKNHTFYLLKNGTIHAEGDNTQGQLGLGHNSSVDDVVKVDFDLKIAQVCCGDNFTLIRTINGEIYGCGDNKYCMIDFFGDDDFSIFFFIKISIPYFNDNEKIIHIDCYPTKYSAVLTDQGHVYTWGCGFYGNLDVDKIIGITCCKNYVICIRYDETIRIIPI